MPALEFKNQDHKAINHLSIKIKVITYNFTLMQLFYYYESVILNVTKWNEESKPDYEILPSSE